MKRLTIQELTHDFLQAGLLPNYSSCTCYLSTKHLFKHHHYNAVFIVAKGHAIALEHIMLEIFAGTSVVGQNVV